MRLLSKSLAFLLLLAAVVLPLGLVGLLGLAWYCTDHTPSVTQAAPSTPADVGRALHLAERNDPRKAKAGMLRTITLTQEELDLVLPHLAARAAKGQAQLQLQDGTAQLQASLPLPMNPFGGYLNVQARLVQTDGLPQLQAVRLGRLALPQSVSDFLLARGMGWLQQRPDVGTAADAIQRVQITPEALSVVYAWHDGLPGQIKSAMLPPDEVQRLQAYQQRLVALTQAAPARQGLALHALLQPLMELAAQRAGSGAGTDAAARSQEQRAALVVLAFYVNGKGLAAVAPAAAEGPSPLALRVHLAGRADLAQHFSVSAVLAAVADTPLADAVGLYKELDDARSGSGFSFVDLAADRAGTRFGALAVGPAAAQARLQRRVATGLTEQDLLPPVRDLPEFMAEAEFKRRYGGLDGAAFKRMQGDIERRVGSLALYR